MAQEDKALVMRGMFLLTLIGVLVTFVLVLIFWRTAPPPSVSERPPEQWIAAALAPTAAEPPGHIWWPAVFQMRDSLPSTPGWEIRYNAAATLARRGSANVPWPLIGEMLDEKQQLRNHRVRLPNGRYVYDEVTARAFTIIALKALATWHEKQTKGTPSTELRELYQRVDELAQSPHEEVKKQAEQTRSTFFPK